MIATLLFCVLGLVAGGILGLRFKALVLIPASIGIIGMMLLGGPVIGRTGTALLGGLLVTVVSLQIGYVLGMLGRASQLGAVLRHRAERAPVSLDRPTVARMR